MIEKPKTAPAERLSALLHVLLLVWLTLSAVFLFVRKSDAATLEFGRRLPLIPYGSLFAGLTAALLVAVRLHGALRRFVKTGLLYALAVFLTVLTTMKPAWPLSVGALLILAAAMFWYRHQPDAPRTWPWFVPPALAGFGIAASGLMLEWSGLTLQTIQRPRSLLWTPLLGLAAVAVGLITAGWQRRQAAASRLRPSSWWPAFMLAAAVLHITALSLLMVARVTAMYTPTYDFGLFAQMFDGMLRTGLPLTTLERSRSLSHFAVHVSPIFYVWLPFYALWPRPETLQVLQIVTVASGAVPLFLLARKMAVDKSVAAVLVIVYLFYPAMLGSSMYDVHENSFLAPLLLWLFFAAETRRRWLYLLFAVLILAVKEDAVLYVIAFGLYLLWSEKMKLAGFMSIVLSFAWFWLVSTFLAEAGEGVMAYRFRDLMTYPAWGLPGVLYTVAMNPAYLLREMFSPEKMHYLQKMLLPLGLLPLLQSRLRNAALFLPLIVMNLVSRYPYQANIGFQYHYGTGVFLIYLALRFFADTPPPRLTTFGRTLAVRFAPRRAVLTLMLTAAVLFGSVLYAGYAWPLFYVRRNAATLNAMRTAMDAIPADAGVRATTFLTTYLSDRPFIIDLGYETIKGADTTPADYLVFDQRGRLDDKVYARLEETRASGAYRVFAEVDKGLIIFERTGAGD